MARFNREVWYYNPTKSRGTQICQNKTRAFLYMTLRRSITQHNLEDCYKLLRLVAKDPSFDPYVLFRYVCILIESVNTRYVNKNFIIYLESLLAKLDLSKPDVYIEYLAYFIKFNRIEDARELYAQRHRFMNWNTHRPMPFISTNLRCYELLLNYLDWEKRSADQEAKFDVSTQGWIVNAMDYLKDVTTNYEYFIFCAVRVLLYYGFYKKAYLIVSKFQKNNPCNISAQLLLYKLWNRMIIMSAEYSALDSDQPVPMICDNEDESEQFCNKAFEEINNFLPGEANELLDLNKYPVASDKRSIIKNLRRLDPRRDEILEFAFLEGNPAQSIQDLMNGLEYTNEINNYSRWKSLHELLLEALEMDEVTVAEVRHLWQSRYQMFWPSMDVDNLIERRRVRKVAKMVLCIFKTNFNAPEESLYSAGD